MVLELRDWYKKNEENSLYNDAGRPINIERYYDECGIKKIWVECEESETEIYSVSIELPIDRHKLINFLLDEVHGREAVYNEEDNLLHIHFDGC